MARLRLSEERDGTAADAGTRLMTLPSAPVRRLRRPCVASNARGRGLGERLKSLPPRSGEVEAVEVHHLAPRRHEVLHELFLRVRARIDFREGSQLGVRTEDQVDMRAGPIDLVCLAVAAFVHAFRSS